MKSENKIKSTVNDLDKLSLIDHVHKIITC